MKVYSMQIQNSMSQEQGMLASLELCASTTTVSVDNALASPVHLTRRCNHLGTSTIQFEQE